MSAPTQLDDLDDDLGLPSRPVPRPRPRLDERPLPPTVPAVVDELPAPRPAAIPEQPAAAAPRVQARPRGPLLRPDVLALVLAAVVCVCVTVLALKGVDVPDVLQTIGLVAVGVGAGTAIPTVGRRP